MARNYKRDSKGRFARVNSRRSRLAPAKLTKQQRVGVTARALAPGSAQIVGALAGRSARKNADRALKAYARGDKAFGDVYARRAYSRARVASTLLR